MRELTRPVYILSGAVAIDTAASAIDHTATLADKLRALGYAVGDCWGCYKKRKEPALVVVDETPGNDQCEKDVLRLARQYGQESVLAIDATRHASLIYCEDEKRESLGEWRAVPQSVAKARDAYTRRAGVYYVAGY